MSIRSVFIGFLAVCLSSLAMASEVLVQDPVLTLAGHYSEHDGRVKEHKFPVEIKLLADGKFTGTIESWIEKRLSDGTSHLSYFSNSFSGIWQIKDQSILVTVQAGELFPGVTFPDINGLKIILKAKKANDVPDNSRLHKIDLKVGMERQQVEEQVAKALSRTNPYSPYGNNLMGGVILYPDGDWVLEVKYKAGSPGPLVKNPNGTIQGLPPMDETVLEYVFKKKPKGDCKELLRDYKGDVILPVELYQTYEKLIAALKAGKQEEIEKFLLPGKVELTTDQRPKESLNYGKAINLPFLKNGFTKSVLNLRKDTDTEYLIRTASTAFWFAKTQDGEWKVSKYLDKPIE